MSCPVIKFAKVHPLAKTPTRGSEFAAGYDLYSVEDVVIPARGRALVNTGIIFELPSGCYGRVASRSGWTLKYGLSAGAGVIDIDYRGVLSPILFNHSDDNVQVKTGDRIAQLICEKIYYPDVVEIDEAQLTKTGRGSNGFGSSGGVTENKPLFYNFEAPMIDDDVECQVDEHPVELLLRSKRRGPKNITFSIVNERKNKTKSF